MRLSMTKEHKPKLETATPLLSVEELSVSYGAIRALKGIDFVIHKSEVVSLIGSNGAGKSTTLNALSGVIRSTGRMVFKGESLNDRPAYQIVKLGLSQSPEGRGVFSRMTVLENLELGAY